uniref:Ion transport domain-containing protein n=1 Tax=Chromera velia CCMP2878 TaxID=1169474 RepID=A0A0G4I0S1_9ALVE|eukprot:Cvel_9986.t1-p1 / transcript=Cvel_9986.t1 / gene=Cvel_9986 / organism=Chromera_velia_CCMP2878 / gene_product=hypothetical protein / transcript_product=hypothetical protein / location=Cvel_scaffold591:13296-23964(-) / protein_length=2072 / sequence_SO=supercontig / SO=protein_coding / is_pseudo=false
MLLFMQPPRATQQGHRLRWQDTQPQSTYRSLPISAATTGNSPPLPPTTGGRGETGSNPAHITRLPIRGQGDRDILEMAQRGQQQYATAAPSALRKTVTALTQADSSRPPSAFNDRLPMPSPHQQMTTTSSPPTRLPPLPEGATNGVGALKKQGSRPLPWLFGRGSKAQSEGGGVEGSPTGGEGELEGDANTNADSERRLDQKIDKAIDMRKDNAVKRRPTIVNEQIAKQIKDLLQSYNKSGGQGFTQSDKLKAHTAASRLWELLKQDSSALNVQETRELLLHSRLMPRLVSFLTDKHTEELRKGRVCLGDWQRTSEELSSQTAGAIEAQGPAPSSFLPIHQGGMSEPRPPLIIAGVCDPSEAQEPGSSTAALFGKSTAEPLLGGKWVPFVQDVLSGKPLLNLSDDLESLLEKTENVLAMHLAASGKQASKLLVENSTGVHLLTWRLSDPTSAKVVHSFAEAEHGAYVPENCGPFSPDGKYLALGESGRSDGGFAIYSIKKGKVSPVCVHQIYGGVLWFEWFACGTKIALLTDEDDDGDEMCQMALFDVDSPMRRFDLQVLSQNVELCKKATPLSKDGQMIAVAVGEENDGVVLPDSEVVIFRRGPDPRRDDPIHLSPEVSDRYPIVTEYRRIDTTVVYFWGWNFFSRRFAVSGLEGMRVVKVQQNKQSVLHRLDTLQAYGSPGVIAWSPYDLLAVCCTGQFGRQNVIILQAEFLSILCITDAHQNLFEVDRVLFSPDETKLAVRTEDRISIYDRDTCRLIQAVPRGDFFTWGPEKQSERLAVWDKGRARLYNLVSGQFHWVCSPVQPQDDDEGPPGVGGNKWPSSKDDHAESVDKQPIGVPVLPMEVNLMSPQKTLLALGMEGRPEVLFVYQIERYNVSMEAEVLLKLPPEVVSHFELSRKPAAMRGQEEKEMKWGRVAWSGNDLWVSVSSSPDVAEGRFVWLVDGMGEDGWRQLPAKRFLLRAPPSLLLPSLDGNALIVKEKGTDNFIVYDPCWENLDASPFPVASFQLLGGTAPALGPNPVGWVPKPVFYMINESALEILTHALAVRAGDSSPKALHTLECNFLTGYTQHETDHKSLLFYSLGATRSSFFAVPPAKEGDPIHPDRPPPELFPPKKEFRRGSVMSALNEVASNFSWDKPLWILEALDVSPDTMRISAVFKVRTGTSLRQAATYYQAFQRSDAPAQPGTIVQPDSGNEEREAKVVDTEAEGGEISEDGDGEPLRGGRCYDTGSVIGEPQRDPIRWRPSYPPQEILPRQTVQLLNGQIQMKTPEGWRCVDIHTGQPQEVLPFTERGVQEIRPSPDGRYVWVKPDAGKPRVLCLNGALSRMLPMLGTAPHWTAHSGVMLDPCSVRAQKRITKARSMAVYDFACPAPPLTGAAKLWIEALSGEDWDSVKLLLEDLQKVCGSGAAGPFAEEQSTESWLQNHPHFHLASQRMPPPFFWSLGHLLVVFRAPVRIISELFQQLPELLLEPDESLRTPLMFALEDPKVNKKALIECLTYLKEGNSEDLIPVCARAHWQGVTNTVELLLRQYPLVGALQSLLDMSVRPPYAAPALGIHQLPGKALQDGKGQVTRMVGAEDLQLDSKLLKSIAPGMNKDDPEDDGQLRKDDIQVLGITLPGASTRDSAMFKLIVERNIPPLYKTKFCKVLLEYKWRAYGASFVRAELLLHLFAMACFFIFAWIVIGCEAEPAENDQAKTSAPEKICSPSAVMPGTGLPVRSVLFTLFAILVLLNALYLLYVKFLEVRKFGMDRIRGDPFSSNDIFLFAFVIVSLILSLVDTMPRYSDPERASEGVSSFTLYFIGFANLLMFYRFFGIARAFVAIGSNVRALIDTAVDIKDFLLVLIILFASFSTSAYIFYNAAEGVESSSLLSAFRDVYLIVIGEGSDFDVWGANWVLISLHVFITLSMVVVVLNFLIALISETFTRIHNRKEETALGEMADILLTTEICRLSTNGRPHWFPEHVLAALPTAGDGDGERDAADVLSEDVAQLKTLVKERTDALQDTVERQRKETQKEIQTQFRELTDAIAALTSSEAHTLMMRRGSNPGSDYRSSPVMRGDYGGAPVLRGTL